MGLKNYQDFLKNVEKLFGNEARVNADSDEFKMAVRNVFEDVEATRYSAHCGMLGLEELFTRTDDWVATHSRAFPGVKTIGAFFDYSRNKPWEVKQVLRRSEEKKPKFIVEEEHLENFLLSRCSVDLSEQGEVEKNFMQTHMGFYTDMRFPELMQTLLMKTEWRRDVNKFFALRSDFRADGFRQAGGRYFVSGIPLDGRHVDIENSVHTETSSTRAGEGEAAMIQAAEAALAADATAPVLCITNDSDALMIALFAMARNAIRSDTNNTFFLRVGPVTFDVPVLFRAIMAWGAKHDFSNPLEAFAVTVAAGGTDYVEKANSLSHTNLIERLNKFGIKGLKVCAGIANGTPRMPLDEWLNSGIIKRWLTAVVGTTPLNTAQKRKRDEGATTPAMKKNPRIARFIDMEDAIPGSDQMILEVLASESLNPTFSKRDNVIMTDDPDLWLRSLCGSIKFQVAYWAMAPTGTHPDPLGKTGEEWNFGWKRVEVEGKTKVIQLHL